MEMLDGRYIGNGEKNVYVKISGLGDPPVVIEPGWGGLSAEWGTIHKQLEAFTTVITYDRPGYGESPKSEKPRTAASIAHQLFETLMNSGVPGPYILVGHSMGGIYIQQFANMFPREVAAVVLVDSVSPYDDNFDELDTPRYNEFASIHTRAENIKKLLEAKDEEFEMTTRTTLENLYKGFPDELKEALITYQTDKKFYETIIAEYEARQESLDLLKNLKDFPKVPLAVICRDGEAMKNLSKTIGIPEEEAEKIEKLWFEKSKELTKLSPKSHFVLAESSNHNIHQTRPEVVVSMIKSLIAQTKK